MGSLYQNYSKFGGIFSIEVLRDFLWGVYFLGVNFIYQKMIPQSFLPLLVLPLIVIDILPFVTELNRSFKSRLSKVYSLFFSIQLFFISMILTKSIKVANKDYFLLVFISEGIINFLLIFLLLGNMAILAV